MTRSTAIAATIGAIWCLCVAALVSYADSTATAANFGPTKVTQRLKGLIAKNPIIGSELTESLQEANWSDILTLDRFYGFVDETVRLIPTEEDRLTGIRPFFYLIGQSAALKNNPAFQDWVKLYLATWGDYLDTTASAGGLDTFIKDPAFHIEDYYVAPSGWLTFNEFFARNVKPGKRPIAGLGDGATIVAPADSVLKTVLPVTADSNVVAKGVSHSIKELLAGSRYSDAFAGGVFMHAFQSVPDYHHFHVPFGGKVLEKRNISAPIWLDVVKDGDGSLRVTDGTGFQWHQQRGMIVLKTDEIGLVAVLPIGMGHVGSVVLTPDVGAELHKGEQFGFFQFGGSDVVMVFQKDKVEITATIGQHYLQGEELGRLRSEAPKK